MAVAAPRARRPMLKIGYFAPTLTLIITFKIIYLSGFLQIIFRA